MKALFAAVAAGLVLLEGPAFAAGDKVKLEIKVVEASTHGATSDPRLAHMARDFKHKGFAYSSYKLVSEPVAMLAFNATTQVPLPNGRVAKLTPMSRGKDGRITMRVEIPGLMDMSYTVSNNGTNFLGAGPLGEGQPNESQVFLVVKHTLG